MPKVLAALAALVLIGSLAACNTVAGIGKDVKATGGAVEQAAEQSKPKK